MNIRSTVLATDRYANSHSTGKTTETASSAASEPKDEYEPLREDFAAFQVGGMFGALSGAPAGAVAGAILNLNLNGVTTQMVKDLGLTRYLGTMLKGAVAGAAIGAVGVGLACGVALALRTPVYEG